MRQLPVPKVHQQFLEAWQRHREALIESYEAGECSFVPSLLPEQAVQLATEDVLRILRCRLGDRLDLALNHADPETVLSPPPAPIRTPVFDQHDGAWLKRTNMVGINVRTLGTFWNVIKYTLTIPKVQDSIHLLPIWEPGVVGSLYGISSWNINTEFFSSELASACPGLDTVERQLKAVINLLHAMGKAVGMDVIPHTDRFSEIVLAHPHFFEWLQREGTEIVDHAENLHEEVQESIMEFLAAYGSATRDAFPQSPNVFFSKAFPEERRLRVLFGPPSDREGRSQRRNALVKHLHAFGYEPVPATMAPPYRGLKVDPETSYTDSQGLVWHDYLITQPQAMSRVFGPLTRYKLYGRLDDNADWRIDFERPRQQVWDYVCNAYYDAQQRYGFDFMRGDMSHVQMRPEGVPESVDETYDILGAVKNYIQKEKGVRCFGYFAESFLAGRNVMVYGDEVDHLEASNADVTLGDLQSTSVGSPTFLQRLRWYTDLLQTRRFAPSFAVITGDKDDPRFDEFYLKGNDLRLFIAYFLTDMPSYMALGFETRDVHYTPAPNEHYSKLYVFQEVSGHKATSGPYVWGRNGSQFHAVTRLRLYAEGMFNRIQGRPTRWLIPPDATGENKHIAWTQGDGQPDYLFVANTDTEKDIRNFDLPPSPGDDRIERLHLEFSTSSRVPEIDTTLTRGHTGFRLRQLAPGEGRVYRIAPA